MKIKYLSELVNEEIARAIHKALPKLSEYGYCYKTISRGREEYSVMFENVYGQQVIIKVNDYEITESPIKDDDMSIMFRTRLLVEFKKIEDARKKVTKVFNVDSKKDLNKEYISDSRKYCRQKFIEQMEEMSK